MISEAIRDPDVVASVTAYASLRAALVLPDTMSTPALDILAMRCAEAAEKYPADEVTPAQRAMNETLLAYVRYVDAVIAERTAAHE